MSSHQMCRRDICAVPRPGPGRRSIDTCLAGLAPSCSQNSLAIHAADMASNNSFLDTFYRLSFFICFPSFPSCVPPLSTAYTPCPHPHPSNACSAERSTWCSCWPCCMVGPLQAPLEHCVGNSVQIWRQMQAGAGAGSQSEPTTQMAEAAQRLPAELRAVLTAGGTRDVRACRAPNSSHGVSILIVAEPSARLSPSELKWASMIAKKVQGCLQPQPAS